MAKKKKSKTQAETPAAAGSREASAADQGNSASAIERAFAVGNNAAVRRLAAQHPSPEAARLLSLARIEPVQIFVGLGALLVMVAVAFLVLRTG